MNNACFTMHFEIGQLLNKALDIVFGNNNNIIDNSV